MIEVVLPEGQLPDEIQRAIKAKCRAMVEEDNDQQNHADLQALCTYQGVINGWWDDPDYPTKPVE